MYQGQMYNLFRKEQISKQNQRSFMFNRMN